MSNPQRLYLINAMLERFGRNHLIRTRQLSEKVFELYVYLKKLEEFAQNGKTVICISINRPGFFRPHFKPGKTRANDYFILRDPLRGNDLDLILNGTFDGLSGMKHSPDIALTGHNSNRIISIYECKNYTKKLTPEVYREVIGYCKELGILVTQNRSRLNDVINAFSVLTPSLYTSGTANPDHVQMMKSTYNFGIFELE
jgi:hypothetical protein